MFRSLTAILVFALVFSVMGLSQISTQPIPGKRVPLLKLPDLIVKKVEVFKGSGEFPPYTFKITIANIGEGNAGPSKTGLIGYTLFNVYKPMEVYLLGEVNTPSIPAGGEVTVVFTTPGTLRAKEYIFVTADFPTKDSQLGAIFESNETNNCYTLLFDYRTVD